MKDLLMSLTVNAQIGNPGDLGLPSVATDSIAGILNLLFFIIGAAAVIMLIVGGLMFVLSSGNPDSIKRAKATLLYAVVGLAVAIFASLIVNLVITVF